MQRHWWPRGLSFLVWALVGLSAAYWGLRLGESTAPSMREAGAGQGLPTVKPAAVVAFLTPASTGTSQAAAAPARYTLVGVIAEGRQGVALLSVDGQPARPYAVGSPVEPNLVLHSVGHRQAELADRSTSSVVQRLTLPEQAPAALPAGVTVVNAAP